MNKMKKLLSVLLAIVMILSSMTVMASAAKTAYKTVNELKELDAYSPYGQVTRLSTEERTSIIFDALDNLLPSLNINMGEVFNVLGLSVTIDLTSIDRLCYSFDTIKDTFTNTLASIAMAIVDLGILESLEVDTWATGMSRDNTAQHTILSEILELLSNNTTLVGKVFSDGLDLGLVSLGDMSSIENIIMNLPGMIKGLVYPMIERWDDTVTDIQMYDESIAGTGKNVEEIANLRVKALFSDNMSITTLKYDANGNMTSEHTNWLATATGSAAPTASASSLRYYYQIVGNTMFSYHIVDAAEAEALAKDGNDTNDVAAYNYIQENQVYRLEQEVEGSETYVWKAYELDEEGNVVKDAEGNDKYLGTLKYYNDDSQFLPGFSGDDFDLRTMSLAEILYTFIPHVFENMAPVVLNGSVKKILADFLGADFNYVGQGGPEADDAVKALADYATNSTFFTEEQGDYLWEWSNYAVINGNHYYRFEDQIFAGDISQKNNYFDIINWDYKITGDFMDEFVPENGGSTTDTLLMNLNDFIIKVANTALKDSAATVDAISGFDAQWTKPTLTSGDNSNLVANIKAIAQAVIGLAPQHVFGSDYAENERCYVELMLDEDDDTVLTGIAAHIVNMVMPSMSLPGKSKLLESNAKVGAILAAVIREFAAYLAPEYNYDALIYADFGTTTADPDKTFVDPEAAGLLTDGQTASGYWLDVCMTMGLDVGYEYLRAFADLGEDLSTCMGAVNTGYGADGKTYAAGTTQAALNAQWEGMLDYIIDWALTFSSQGTKEINGEFSTLTDTYTTTTTKTTSGCSTVDTQTQTVTQTNTMTTGTATLTLDNEWTWKFEKLVNTTGLTIDMTTAQDPWVKLDQILDSLLPVDEILNVTATDCETELEQLLRYNLILAIVDLRWDDLADMLKVPDGFVRDADALDSLATVLKNLINGIFAKIGNTSGNFELIPSVITDFDTLANQDNLVTMIKSLVGALYTAAITNNGWDVLAPFLNFFLGWKMDPQKIADPVIWTQFRDNNDYAFQYNISAGGAIDTETKIVILNNSAGMLETHRNSSVTDHAYDINIRSITSDATVNTLTFTYDNVVSPYEQIVVQVGGTYNGDEAVTVTIEYDYVGKDGQAVGGTQYTSLSFLISNLYEDSNLSTCQANDHDNDYTGLTDVKGYVFTENLYESVVNYEAEIHYVSASFSNPDKSFQSCQPESNGAITAPASNYFAQYTGQAGGWADTLSKDGTTSTRGKLYYALDGVSEETFKPTGETDAEIATDAVYGAYDMGEIGVKYGSDTKVIIVDFIYYNDFDIYDIYTENKDNGYNAYQGVDEATWEAYRVAWNNIVKLATYPMMTTSRSTANWEGVTAQGTAENDYVSVIMPQIPAAIEAYETAKEAYEKALANAQASGSSAALPSYVQDLQAEIENDFMNGKEINFQDYEFYEYFNYNDVKVAGENLYRTYLAPKVMDKYYIVGSGISEAELDEVIADETNPYIAAGITASRAENDQAAIDASIAAKDAWTMPITSKLIVDDMTSRIAFYKQFLVEANMENALTEEADHLKFLEKEIAHVEAQQLVESDYTEASWAAYAEALEEAKAVAAGNDPEGFSNFNSRIYDVKYNLMVAYKNLLAKNRSLIVAGGTAELLENIDTANAIFASLEAGDGTWKVKNGVDANEAYAQLISALGYNYQAVYSENDVEVQNGEKAVGDLKYNGDGTPMMFNLYADSALEYAENDRPNNQNNQAKVNTANTALYAAIQNFTTGGDPSTLMVEEGFEYADYVVIDTVNNNYGEFTGIVYGIDTLDQNNYFEALATLDDALTTNNGDDYLVIEANDQGVESTGAKITVVDENGDALETYYFVYFGDIDGDGMVTAGDGFYAELYEMETTGIESFAQYVSADVDVDGMVTAGDGFYTELFEMEGDGMEYQYVLAETASGNEYEWISE